MHCARLVITFLGASLAASVLWAQAADDTVDRSKIDHAAMGHGAPAGDGPWSYENRNNPEPHKQNRWDMVPVPQYGHMFLSTKSMSPELRCAALRDNPGVMVDRAARKACGMPELPASMSKSPAGKVVDHEAMGH